MTDYGGSGLRHTPTEALRAEVERRECESDGHPPDLVMVSFHGELRTALCRCGSAKYRIERVDE